MSVAAILAHGERDTSHIEVLSMEQNLKLLLADDALDQPLQRLLTYRELLRTEGFDPTRAECEEWCCYTVCTADGCGKTECECND